MNPDDGTAKRSLRYPVVLVLLVLAVVMTALVTLLLARLWLYAPEVEPVVLDRREEVQLDRKLAALSGEQGPYSEDRKDRVIYLTERELNALLARNPDLSGRASLHLSEDLISASLLLDIPSDFPILAGRTIPVKAGLHVGRQHGRPTLVLEGVSLLGVPIPKAWLGDIKGRNLLKPRASGDGIGQRVREGIRDIRVEEGGIRIEFAE